MSARVDEQLWFWNSSVLKSSDGVSSGDPLANSSKRGDVALLLNCPVVSAKNTLLIDVCCGPGNGIFFFSTHDRLKVGVREGGDELLI